MWKVARRPVSRVGLLTLAIVAGTAGSLAGPAAPAAASVPGLKVVDVQSAWTSDDKTVTARCPAGKKVIDAGGSIGTGFGKVTMDDVFPDPTMSFVNVTGLETDTFNENWWAVAYATCADPLPGLEWIKALTVSDSATSKTLTVSCSPGKTVLGNGYAVTGGDGEVFVDEAVPDGGPGVAATHVSLIGVEGDPYDGNWELEGFVICANPLPGQQVLSRSTTASTVDKGLGVSCGNQVATGGTAELHNGTGAVVLTDDYALDHSANAIGAANDGTTSAWWITAYAFCVDA